jgi:hypothetical protein
MPDQIYVTVGLLVQLRKSPDSCYLKLVTLLAGYPVMRITRHSTGGAIEVDN